MAHVDAALVEEGHHIPGRQGEPDYSIAASRMISGLVGKWQEELR